MQTISKRVGSPYALLAHFWQRTMGGARPIDEAGVSGWEVLNRPHD
jgi:hypothetical protein